MKMNRTFLFLLCVAIVLTLCACKHNDDSSQRNTLNVALGSEPNTLDPALSLTIDTRSYLAHIFEGLTNFSKDGAVVPGVAVSWTVNDDNTEYTFQIRDDAVWSDGSKVLAEDFIYGWLRVLNPETASGWASYLYYIKGAEAYNTGLGKADEVGLRAEDRNLIVELENPCPFFVEMTAMQPYYPVKQTSVETYGDAWASNADTMVFNGPYVVSEWLHDEQIKLTKNGSYWNVERALPDTINFYLMADSNATMNAYESGILDFEENILTSAEKSQIDEIQSCNFAVTKFLSLNLKRDVFSDERIRQAIAIALDRTSLASIMGESYFPLSGWVPRGFINSDSGIDYLDEEGSRVYFDVTGNLDEAKELLEDAGHPNGEGLPPLSYLTSTSSSNVQLAEAVKYQLEQLGLTINIGAYEDKIFNDYRAKREFDIVAASWAAEYPDISSYFYGMLSTNINNYASFADEQFDNLYRKALSLSGSSERFPYYHDLENIAMDSFAIIPLYGVNTEFIAKENVSGFYHDVTGCLHLEGSSIK